MAMIGRTLGNFTLEAQIGKGGMGEVYKAKDRKLGRDVAIKVLPEEFARDTDRVARFQREAKLLASLNHPNIGAIHGLEESDDTHFLVLELIEGGTLADRIKAGPIPVEEALKLALQIAEALEAAHEKGVIHRDLKPANIKVTPDGKAKVLDFGLAKAFAGEQPVNLSNSPTLSEAATQQGVILGTAAYMSPEQARGKPVDKRTDIWAFGCVLYEMLTGKAAFQGEDVTEILAAVVKSGVNLDLLPANIHLRIREVIIRCLQKEQKKRYGGIGEAHYEIEQVLADPGGVFSQPAKTVKPRKKLQIGIPWIAATAILCLIIAGMAGWFFTPAEPKRVLRLEYELPEGRLFNRSMTGEVIYELAVSPDGSRFVYSTTDGLYLRDMNALDARHIAGTDKGSAQPFFSPDGKWIGYWSQSDMKLKKVGISGGAPTVLCDVGIEMEGASWDTDDTIVFSEIMSGIMQVSANGGTPETLIKASLADFTKDGFPAVPRMLPDGDTLLFTNVFGSGLADYQIVVQSLRSGKREVLFKGAFATYLPTGHIVYALVNNDIGNLFAVPFDLDKLKVTGGSISVLEGAHFSAFSDSGTLVYIPQPAGAAGTAGAASSGNTLAWVDRQGKEEPLGAEPKNYQEVKISPDGSKVALTINDAGSRDIWIWDISHQTPTRLTFDKAEDSSPVWTPDGKRIVFCSRRNGILGGIYRKSADGVGEDEPLGAKPDRAVVPRSFSHDGKFLATLEYSLNPLGVDIGMMSMEGNREMSDLLKEDPWELDPQISPDGRYMAYQSDESGAGNIYVRPFPNVNEGKWQVSSNGGNSPLWSPDGRELFYRNGDETVAVEVETEPAFKHGNPRILFQGTYLSNNILKVALTPWDISHDGRKFLMIKPPAAVAGESSTAEQAAAARQPKIIVVTNWFEELKERVPVD
jgi:serine/threonine protein kinase/Tol biopolymer transport system component